MTTRRHFLKTSSLAALATVRPTHWDRGAAPPHGRRAVGRIDPGVRATDPALKALALRALEAAKSAGASYADVRFTFTQLRSFSRVTPTAKHPDVDTTAVALGVRALANGAWGFSADATLTPDGAATLGRTAVELARHSAWPGVPSVHLLDRPPAVVGHWETPIKRDPFQVPIQEVAAFIDDIEQAVFQYGIFEFTWLGVFTFQRQERLFASTDGAYLTQTVHTAFGGQPHTDAPPSSLMFKAKPRQPNGIYYVPTVTPTGGGYEALEALNILGNLPEWHDKAVELLTQEEFQDLGETDIIFDAHAMAALVNGTLGGPLEYDRAVGYEGGVASYLAPPLTILGTSQTSPLVTLTADRTLRGGCATVAWDDEGVAVQPVPLVKGGVVVDYAASREFVAELAPWYQRHGGALRSTGCAAAESAATAPLVATPNLVLQPGQPALSLSDLVSHVDKGLLVCGGSPQLDFQQLSGRGTGAQVYRIKHGRLVGAVDQAMYTFRTQDLWKHLVRLGGAQTSAMRGFAEIKGEPDQMTMHSVQAVAAHFTQVRVGNASTM